MGADAMRKTMEWSSCGAGYNLFIHTCYQFRVSHRTTKFTQISNSLVVRCGSLYASGCDCPIYNIRYHVCNLEPELYQERGVDIPNGCPLEEYMEEKV